MIATGYKRPRIVVIDGHDKLLIQVKHVVVA